MAAQLGMHTIERLGLAVDSFNHGACGVQLLVLLALTVERVAQTRADTGRNRGGAAAFVPVRITNRAARGRGSRIEQRAAVLLARVLDQVRAVLVVELQGHRQFCRTQWRAIS